MTKVQIDTVYGIDGGGPADETIQDVIDKLSNEYHVTGVVVGQSTGGGWPIVEWTGTQDELAELIAGQFDDGSGDSPLVRFPEIGNDDEGGTFPIVCANGCPEGSLGRHKFSCSLARPSSADNSIYESLTPHAALRRLETLLDSVNAREAGESALQRLWTHVLKGE